MGMLHGRVQKERETIVVISPSLSSVVNRLSLQKPVVSYAYCEMSLQIKYMPRFARALIKAKKKNKIFESKMADGIIGPS
jgi:hypothetical protein